MSRPKQLVMAPFDCLPESLRFQPPPLDHDEQMDAHWDDPNEDEEPNELEE